MLFMLLSASASFAQRGDDAVVRWKSIAGVINAQGVNNPVSPPDDFSLSAALHKKSARTIDLILTVALARWPALLKNPETFKQFLLLTAISFTGLKPR